MTAATLRRLIVIGLIALWEILPRAGVIPELFLPSLSSTLAAGWNDAGEYGHALAVTLYEVAISMASVTMSSLSWITGEPVPPLRMMNADQPGSTTGGSASAAPAASVSASRSR